MTEQTDSDTMHADERTTDEADAAVANGNDSTAVDGADADADAQAKATPSAREARYRRRLRDTEAERDRLAEQLRSRDRSDVERRVADRLDRPADVWLVWDDAERFHDDDGNLDTDAVDAAVAELLRERPSWAKRTRRRDPDQGRGRRADTYDRGSWLGVVRRGR